MFDNIWGYLPDEFKGYGADLSNYFQGDSSIRQDLLKQTQPEAGGYFQKAGFWGDGTTPEQDEEGKWTNNNLFGISDANKEMYSKFGERMNKSNQNRMSHNQAGLDALRNRMATGQTGAGQQRMCSILDPQCNQLYNNLRR